MTISAPFYFAILSPFTDRNNLSFLILFRSLGTIIFFLSRKFWIVIEFTPVPVGALSSLKGVAHVFALPGGRLLGVAYWWVEIRFRQR